MSVGCRELTRLSDEAHTLAGYSVRRKWGTLCRCTQPSGLRQWEGIARRTATTPGPDAREWMGAPAGWCGCEDTFSHLAGG